ALEDGVLPPGCTQNPDGSVSFQTPNPVFGPASTTSIDYNVAVLGLWWKPTSQLSINLDGQVGSGTDAFTPLGSKNFQEFRARAHYRISTQLNLTAFFQTSNGQNPAANINGSQHDRSAGFTLGLTPSEKFSAQLGYNYNNIHFDYLICYTSDF